MLKIKWNYPVLKPIAKRLHTKGTQSPYMEIALEAPAAFELLAKEDKRPLLVLREFSKFDDPGNKKLSGMLFTESTVLLAHWFNCVRLPHHVTEEKHPFHNLYLGDKPAQLFMASPDGSKVVPFDYLGRRANLDDAMIAVLEQYYDGNPKSVLKDLIKMIPRFDTLDERIQRYKEELDRLVEKSGSRNKKFQQMKKKLEQAKQEFKDLEAKKKELQKLTLLDG